ncbi:MAG TPA: hypothetical protein VD913_06770, partial [bacterium]|nr:hypothetical protein [bacterium]
MILFIRLLFILGFTLFGYFFSAHPWFQSLDLPQPQAVGAILGFLIGVAGVTIDVFLKRYTVRNLLSIIVGTALGLLIHRLLMNVLGTLHPSEAILQPVSVASAFLFSYLGAITILRGADEYSLMIPFVKLDSKGAGEELILLDTSVIIDGRIADICETHFLSGKLVLPRFVLKELQLIADSSDPLKRNRGRRGLDVL